jgi:hypothetical protein
MVHLIDSRGYTGLSINNGLPGVCQERIPPAADLTIPQKWIFILIGSDIMEELEIASWLTLDALKKAADVVETVGSLQTGHSMSVFCEIEDDCLELCYSDSAANTIRRFEDREEFEAALEQRKEEVGDAPFEEEQKFGNDFEEDEDEEEEEAGDGFHVEEEADEL